MRSLDTVGLYTAHKLPREMRMKPVITRSISKSLITKLSDFLESSGEHSSSVIRQKAESQSGCFKKTKHAEFFEKQTFLTP